MLDTTWKLITRPNVYDVTKMSIQSSPKISNNFTVLLNVSKVGKVYTLPFFIEQKDFGAILPLFQASKYLYASFE